MKLRERHYIKQKWHEMLIPTKKDFVFVIYITWHRIKWSVDMKQRPCQTETLYFLFHDVLLICRWFRICSIQITKLKLILMKSGKEKHCTAITVVTQSTMKYAQGGCIHYNICIVFVFFLFFGGFFEREKSAPDPLLKRFLYIQEGYS